jgi:hypothetical protein
MKPTRFFSWSMVGRGVAAPFSFRTYVPGRSTSPLCNGRQLHVSQPSLSVLVLVELKEWPEAAQIRELQSGPLDIGIDHLEELSDRLESMLLLRERFVLVLPKNHPAARKRAVNFKDLLDDLLLIPRRDLFPTVHQSHAANRPFNFMSPSHF